MIAFELLIHLHHLLLSEEDGELGWIGTQEQWQLVSKEIREYDKA